MGTFLQKKIIARELLKCVSPDKSLFEDCTNQQEFLSACMSFKVGFIDTLDFIAINYEDSKFVT